MWRGQGPEKEEEENCEVRGEGPREVGGVERTGSKGGG